MYRANLFETESLGRGVKGTLRDIFYGAMYRWAPQFADILVAGGIRVREEFRNGATFLS